jgi:hypothetical protein
MNDPNFIYLSHPINCWWNNNKRTMTNDVVRDMKAHENGKSINSFDEGINLPSSSFGMPRYYEK